MSSVLVYSTEGGRTCPGCRQPIGACACRTAAAAVPSVRGVARVSLQRKGRAGKGVTLVHDLGLAPGALATLAQALRQACGCGGTVKSGVIEIQGDQRDRVVACLQARGWRTRQTGG